MTRRQQLDRIWRKTHSDYKGTIEGRRMVMLLRNGGTVLAPLDSLTAEEIAKFK